MNLNEYLKNTCTQVKKPRLVETDSMKSVFSTLSFYILGSDYHKQINIHEIYSSEVYPRYVRVNEQDYILWDSHFWDLYGLFLHIHFSYNDLQATNSKEYYKSLLFLFLSSRFEKVPSLSRYIAEEYKNLLIKIFRYDKNENVNNILSAHGHLEELNIGRIFGFCHEIAHVAFRKKNQLSCNVMNKVLDYCKDCIELFMLTKDLNLITENNASHLEIAYSISKQLVDNNDGRILEEICCDVIAMYAMVTYFEIEGLNKMDIADKIAAIDYFLVFTWWLSSNEQFWNTMRLVYLNPIENDTAFVDEKSIFYNFGDRITEELSVRSNFTINFLAEFSKIPIQNKRKINNLLNGGLYQLLQQSNGYDDMQRILNRYSMSHKDLNSGVYHLRKKNGLVGWVI